MFICKICSREFEKPVQLTTHIQFNHKEYSAQTYYDTFLKQPTDGICKTCGKTTTFKGIAVGYAEFCSRKCAWQDPTIKAKRAATNSLKTDDDRVAWRRKYVETKLKLYGKAISTSDAANRQTKSEEHFKDYLAHCNCEFVSYVNKKVTFKCNVCGVQDTFVRSLVDRYARNNDYSICHVCNSRYTSKPEKEVYNYIKSICTDEIIQRDKQLIGKELDIIIPSKQLAIEFDGLYWHNDSVIADNAHVNKTNACEQNNYQLIHIFEDEWNFKQDIVKSRLSGLLHKNTVIYARKTIVKEVDAHDAGLFLDENHIQGKCTAKYKLGLYYNDELVSLMTFGKSRFADEFELLRFCNKKYTNVVGGASKLFKAFTKMHPEITKIVSYADRRWSKGNLYEKLGFTKLYITEPSYFYIVNHKRESRIKYQKHKLVAQGFDSSKTEKEIMKERCINRIYDCGTIKYEFVANYAI